MAIRMIVTDMDGTLLGAKNRVSEANRAALAEAAAEGVHVAIATGRMHASALPYAKEIGVTAPIISCNGALVKTTAGEELFSAPITPDAVRAVLDYMKGRGWYVQVYSDDRLLFVERDHRACAYEEAAGVKGEAVGWDGLYALAARVHKLLSISDRAEETAGRAAELSRLFAGKIEAVRSKEKYVDIMAVGVSKAASIERLAARYDISMQEVHRRRHDDGHGRCAGGGGLSRRKRSGGRRGTGCARLCAGRKVKESMRDRGWQFD